MDKKRKTIVKLIVSFCFVLVAVVLEIIVNSITSALESQNLAKRWGGEYAQVSFFFSKNTSVTDGQILSVERTLGSALEEAAVISEHGERVFVDSYSTVGKGLASSERTRNMNVRVVGVGGDFFLFHPYEIKSGAYFNDNNDENEDGVIIDDTVAWQLFGATDITEKTINIGNTSFVVRGVIKEDEGYFSETAKENDATVYMSYEAYQKLFGGETGTVPIENYEILVKNPVKDLGKNKIEEAFAMDEGDYEIIENSSRYKLLSRFIRLKKYGELTMNVKLITYPFWENRARGYDQLALAFTAFEVFFLIYPFICLLELLIFMFRKKEEFKYFLKTPFRNMEKELEHKKAEKWIEKNEKKPKEENKDNDKKDKKEDNNKNEKDTTK